MRSQFIEQSPIYKPIVSQVFSLSRLEQLSGDYPSEIEAGGRVVLANDEELLLSGGSLFLECHAICFQDSSWKISQTLEVGDLVVLNFSAENIKMLSENKFVVSEANHCHLLSTSHREIKPKNLVPALDFESFIDDINSYFLERGLKRVRTPYLVECPGIERTIEPFSTSINSGSLKKKLFLPTSPEIHLKKILSRDLTDIFEFKTCFRHEDLSPLHEPEFLMLEWYRAFSNLELIKEDLVGLLNYLKEKSWIKRSFPEVTSASVADLFNQHLNFELKPQTSQQELLELARQLELDVNSDLSFDDLFHLIFMDCIEPRLDKNMPTLVFDYPPSQCALARIGENGWASRFELYWGGCELANAFDELTDPIEQRRRMEKDLQQRKESGFVDLSIDESFISALEHGLPPTGGIALGVDRLFMVCTDIQLIEETRVHSAKDILRT